MRKLQRIAVVEKLIEEIQYVSCITFDSRTDGKTLHDRSTRRLQFVINTEAER